MKKISFILSFVFCSALVTGQEILWEKIRKFDILDSTHNERYRNAVWYDSDHFMVFAQSDTGNFFDVYDLDGNLTQTIWGNPYTRGGSGRLLKLEDNQYLYASSTYTHLLLQYFNARGDTLPSRLYRVGNQRTYHNGLIQTKDRQHFVSAGWSTNQNSNGFISVIKVDKNLDEQWFNYFPSINIDSAKFAFSCKENYRGNYVVIGDMFSFSRSSGLTYPYLVEITPGGDTVQTKWLIINFSENASRSEANSVLADFVQTSDLGYIFPVQLDTFYQAIGVANTNIGVIKVDSNFNLLWKTVIKPSSINNKDMVTYSTHELANGIIMTTSFYFTDSVFINFISPEGGLIKTYRFKSNIGKIIDIGETFFLNDSSIIITGIEGKSHNAYIARIGRIGNPMYPDPRPAPYIAPPEPVYTIPNLITPNNDGQNETFEIRSNQIPATGVQLTIYNRWGSQIYTSPNYQHNWAADGLPDGVYYYQADVKDKKYKGWVQVVR